MEAIGSFTTRKTFLARLGNRNALIAAATMALAAAYLALFYAKTHVQHGPILFAVGNTILRMVLDMCVVASGFSLYLSGKTPARSAFPLMAAFSIAALIQMVYGACVQVLSISQFGPTGETMMVCLHLGFLLSAGRFLFLAKREKAMSSSGLKWIAIGLSALGASSFVLIGREISGTLSGGLPADLIEPICAMAQFFVLVGLTE